MATFAPNTNIDPGREYDFRGAQPNDAVGVLLKGSAGAIGDVIDAEYKVVNKDIRERARAGEEQIQENLFATSDLAAAQSSTTEAGVARPEELTRGIDKMQKLKNAWTKGAITESDYLSSVDVLTRGLRSRYGHQWADEIDSAVSAAVSNSANAYRKQLFEEWDSKKSAADKASEKESDRKWQLVKENESYLSHRPDILADPDKFSYGEIRAAYIEPKAKAQKISDDEAEINHKKTIRGVSEGEVVELGKRRVGSEVQRVLTAVGNSNNQGLLEKIAEMRKSGGTIDANEKQQLTDYFAQMKNEMDNRMNQVLLEDTYITLPSDKKKEMRDIAQGYIDSYKDTIFNDQYGPMVLWSNSIKWKTDDVVNKAVNLRPDLADNMMMVKGLEQMGLAPYLNDWLTTKLTTEQTLIDPSITEGYARAGNIMLGNGTLADMLRALQQARRGTKEADDVISAISGTLTSPLTPPEGKAAAAQALFDPKNGDILAQDVTSPGLATQFFNSFTRPEMVKTMIDMKQTNPQAWVNYYDWVFDQSFKATFTKEINNMLPDAAKITGLKFDMRTSQFTYTVPQVEYGGKKVVMPFIKDVDATVTRLNRWIKRVEPLIKSEGLEPIDEVMRVLEQAGLPTETNGKRSLLEDFRKIVKSNTADKKDSDGGGDATSQ